MFRFFQATELRRAIWTFRRQFFIVFAFTAVSNLLMLTPVLYLLQVFDRVKASHSMGTLVLVTLIVLFLYLQIAVADWARTRVITRAGMQFDALLATRVFQSSYKSYLSQSSNTPSRAFHDLIQVRQFLTGPGMLALLDLPWIPFYLAIVFLIHPLIGWVAIAFGVLQAVLAWRGHQITAGPAEAAAAASTNATLYMHSKLRNAEAIEAMGMRPNLLRRWRSLQNTYLDAEEHAHDRSDKVATLSKFVRRSQASLVLGTGALLAIWGLLSPTRMVVCNILTGRALAPIDMLLSVWRSLVPTQAAYQRLEQLLEDFPEGEAELHRVAPRGELELRDVVATAPGRADPILKGVTLTCSPGTVTAILGPSGSGKSTLARTIMGIWPDVSGEVLIDGLPVQGWNRAELGPNVGYLPQDIELFDASIGENIARLGPVKSDKVIEASRLAGLHELILRFPKGYDTQVGDGGRLLSGGQRQRIGLARAVYGNPSLIVLDEPNSNLDDAGETALIRALQQLKANGATVIVISHRAGVMQVVDNVALMQDGVLKAVGPRDQVLALRQPAAAPSVPPAGAAGVQPA